MNDNTKTPYEWYSVLNWTASLFLWGLVANSAISKSPGGRIVFGLTWAIIGLIAVGVFKYFKRSKILSREQLQIDSEKADKVVFYACIFLGVLFIGQALFLKSIGTLGDAAIYIALGFWVKSRSTIARWVLAVYAFVSAIFVTTQGLSAGGMVPFIFFVIGWSIIANRKYELSEQDSDSIIPPKIYPSAKYTTTNPNSHSSSSNSVAIDDDDRFFTQVAKELVNKQIDDGLWAKAFALQDGDEKKTKAQYIKLRVEQLSRTTEQPQLVPSNINSTSKGKRVFETRTVMWGIGLVIIVVGGIMIRSSNQTVETADQRTTPVPTQSKTAVFEGSLLGEWNCRNSKLLFRKVYYDDNQYRQTPFVNQPNDWAGGGSWKLIEGSQLVEEDSVGKFTYEISWKQDGNEVHLTNILDRNFEIICIKNQ